MEFNIISPKEISKGVYQEDIENLPQVEHVKCKKAYQFSSKFNYKIN